MAAEFGLFFSPPVLLVTSAASKFQSYSRHNHTFYVESRRLQGERLFAHRICIKAITSKKLCHTLGNTAHIVRGQLLFEW